FAVKAASGGALLGEGLMQMDRNVLTCAGRVFPLAEIDRFAIVDQMTLLFSTKAGNDYEVRSETPRSASKYLEIFRILCD
ncbi:MAG: hypothetical protein FWC62_01775, partial [Firmicutes bacterium]|nr:hypothetical protein [Bacillota bacterium]